VAISPRSDPHAGWDHHRTPPFVSHERCATSDVTRVCIHPTIPQYIRKLHRDAGSDEYTRLSTSGTGHARLSMSKSTTREVSTRGSSPAARSCLRDVHTGTVPTTPGREGEGDGDDTDAADVDEDEDGDTVPVTGGEATVTSASHAGRTCIHTRVTTVGDHSVQIRGVRRQPRALNCTHRGTTRTRDDYWKLGTMESSVMDR